MVPFAEIFADREIVATLSRQLNWSHFVNLLPNLWNAKTDGLGLFLCADANREKVKLLQMQKGRPHRGQIFATGSNKHNTVRGYGIMLGCRYRLQPPKTRFLLSSSKHLH